MGFLLRNWHLKLSAVLLATVLYTGIVFSGAFDEATIQVRIEQVNQPANSYVLTGDLGFGLPAGDIALVAGYEYREEYYDRISDLVFQRGLLLGQGGPTPSLGGK